jgi:protoheme IX farnesyltransferase
MARPGRAAAVQAARRVADFLALTKPRVVLMVLVTTAVGFYLGSPAAMALVRLLHTLLGTALAAAGTIALNQYLEREGDALMERTRRRPLPAGRLDPLEALAFGVLITAGGLAYMALAVDPLGAMVNAVVAASYLFVYTPLKRRTTLCTLAGAVSGALPPVTGWVAARGEFGAGAWILFAILFLWQIPHSLAIGRMYREDYARAGIRLLPVVEPDGVSTGRQVVSYCLALMPVGLLPTLIGMAGSVYFAAALALGAVFLAAGIGLARAGSLVAARRLVFVSLAYLPAVLLLMAADKVRF